MAREPLFDLPAPAVVAIVLGFFVFGMWMSAQGLRYQIRAAAKEGQKPPGWSMSFSSGLPVALAKRWPLSLGFGGALVLAGTAMAPIAFLVGGAIFVIGAILLLMTGQGLFMRRVLQQEMPAIEGLPEATLRGELQKPRVRRRLALTLMFGGVWGAGWCAWELRRGQPPQALWWIGIAYSIGMSSAGVWLWFRQRAPDAHRADLPR